MLPQAQLTKGKIGKLNLIKIKKRKTLLCKRFCKEDKNRATNRKKYLQVTYSRKELYLEYVKSSLVSSEETNDPIRKWAEDKTVI